MHTLFHLLFENATHYEYSEPILAFWHNEIMTICDARNNRYEITNGIGTLVAKGHIPYSYNGMLIALEAKNIPLKEK